jgi:hypothetical protein
MRFRIDVIVCSVVNDGTSPSRPRRYPHQAPSGDHAHQYRLRPRRSRPFNLSFVAFFGYGAFTILFGGDLETDGWLALLRFPAFRELLKKVNVLVASHHGRDNGRCEDVFKWCRPDVVVMSDYDIRHQSQETVGWYRNRVTGIPDHSVPWVAGIPRFRHVLTTRNDGNLKIAVQPDGRYTVYPERLLPSASLNSLANLLRSA